MSRILIVDDERHVVELLSEQLTMQGYQVEAVETGEDALERMQEQQPDLLLLDIMLPGMDGYEVCTTMQNHSALRDIPIVMLTACASAPELAAGYQAGADDYVTKPFDLEELLIRIRVQLHHPDHERLSALTALPGTAAVRDEIERRRDRAERWRFLCADVTNLRAFNQAYSFSEGDQLIRLAAEALQAARLECGDPEAFVGHLGGPNFVAVVPRLDEARFRSAASRWFDELARGSYLRTDRARGYFLAIDTDGRARQWELPSLQYRALDPSA